MDQPTEDKQRPAGASGGWLIGVWLAVVAGLALAAEGGVLYAHAQMNDAGPSWMVGLVAVLIGAGLSGCGIYAILARGRAAGAGALDELPVGREVAIPMLGALLVYKYRMITEEDLERALAQQRVEGGERRLGGILLDLGLISAADLHTALEYQRSLAGAIGKAQETQDEQEQPKVGVADAT